MSSRKLNFVSLNKEIELFVYLLLILVTNYRKLIEINVLQS